jgi:hypothetical protein
MTRQSALFGAALVIWLICGFSTARAEDIGWSYSWSGTASVPNDGGGGVKFTFGAGEFKNNQNGVTAAVLEAFGPAGNINSGYSLSMHLVDKKSSAFADIAFSGVLSGPTNLGLQNTFQAPVAWSGDLGGNHYGVVIGLYSAPGATDSGVKGVLAANVVVTPGGSTDHPTPPPVTQAPEPGSLTLAATGVFAILGLFALRRRLVRRPIPEISAAV